MFWVLQGGFAVYLFDKTLSNTTMKLFPHFSKSSSNKQNTGGALFKKKETLK